MTRSRDRYEDLTPTRRHRVEAVLLARSALFAVLLVVVYSVLPLDRPVDSGFLVLLGGLVLTAAMITWQIREIITSPFPRLRGFQTLISGIPLVLVVFAAVYYLTGQAQINSFTQPMSKIDAMYFTVTVFSTVGFGDITAKTELARTLVTVQMLFNLVVLGLVAKLIFGAVSLGLKRRTAEEEERTGNDHQKPAPG
jgi:voltage-gated potassium channel